MSQAQSQCAASWLITALPQLAFTDDPAKIFARSANEHRSFIPCNCYPTNDGYVYLAIGNDIQWQKLTQIPGFEHLTSEARRTNQGRDDDKVNIYADIRKGLEKYSTLEIIDVCQSRSLSIAPVNTTHDVAMLDFVQENMMKTVLPSGEKVGLFPPSISTDFLNDNHNTLKCAPRLGADNDTVFSEAGLSHKEISSLKETGII